MLESIVVDEMCEFKGRQTLAADGTNVAITSLIRTEPVDVIPSRHVFCYEIGSGLPTFP